MKKSRKAPPRAKRGPSRRHAAVTHEHDDRHHACACDVDFAQMEATPDHELPPARGGIAMAGRRRASARVSG